MALSKRATIYLEPILHHILRIKAAQTERTISEIVNEAVRQSLAEDHIDLAAFTERKSEPVFSLESVLKELKKNGKI